MKTFFVLFFGVLLNSALGHLAPTAEEEARLRAEGKWEEAKAFMDGHGHHEISPDLLEKAEAKLRRQMLKDAGVPKKYLPKKIGGREGKAVPVARKNLPTTGSPKILVMLLSFPDEAASVTRAQVQSAVFGNGLADRKPYESLTKYYERASYGKLKVEGNVLAHTYSRTRAAEQGDLDRPLGPSNSTVRETMILEAMQAHDAMGHDFSQYDNDGDGLIDGLVVLYAGDNTGWGSFWWAYYANAADNGPFVNNAIDGVRGRKHVFQFIDVYEDQDENVVGFDPTTLMHEFGHMIGLPDLYDYSPGVLTGPRAGPEGGVGGLDMMHGNRGDINGFSKWLLDWNSPQVMTGGWQRVVLGPNGGASDREGVVMLPGGSGANWLHDSFTKVFLQGSLWDVRTTGVPTGAAVNIDAGRVKLTGRGHLITDKEFDPDDLGGIKVAGRWTFTAPGGDGNDFFEVLTRSDGQVTSPFGQTANGVSFRVETATGNLSFVVRNTAGQLAVTQTTTGSVGPIAAGTSWDFEVFDDSKTGLTFRFTKSDNPNRTATVIGKVTRDDFSKNYVVFHNREGAGRIAHLDDVAVIPGPTATDLFREFYYVENRSPVGNDAGSDWPQRGSSALNFNGGLAIWHVDATLTPDRTKFLYNSSHTTHKHLRLMEADGEEDIEGRREGDAGDFWKPGQQFAPDSIPDSKLYDNSFSGVAVSVLDQFGDDIEAHLSFWTNPDARRPTVSVSSPSQNLVHTADSQTMTVTGIDQSNDGSRGNPVIEFYEQGNFGSEFARFDRTATTVSATWRQNTLGRHGAYALVYDAGDWPYVVASSPLRFNSKIGFPGDSRPSNTIWSGRTTLSGSVTMSASNGGASTQTSAFDEPEDPTPSATSVIGRTVWYQWAAPGNGRLTIDTEGSALDTVLGVYTGGRLDRLKEVASDDDGGVGSGDSKIENLRVVAGTNYSIAVSGYNGASGIFNLTLNFTLSGVTGDSFDNPRVVNVDKNQFFTSLTTDTTNATTQSSENNHDGRPPHHSVWVRVNIEGGFFRSGRLILTTLGSEFDTVLAVYTLSGGDIGSNDDYFSDRTSGLSIPAVGGDSFLVAIDGYNTSDFGPGNINVRFVQGVDENANVAPSVVLSEPISTLEVELGQSVTLEANAFDSDGLVKEVAFYEAPGGLLADRIARIFATRDARYEASWTPTETGSYDVTALVWDERGQVGVGTPVTVNVTIGGVVPTPLGAALDLAGGLLPTQSGDRDWLGQEVISKDGVDAARSHPNLESGESSEMSIPVTGPGVVSYWWKSEGRSFTNRFELLLDGRPVEVRKGTMDWTQVAVQIPPGSHTIGWRFQNLGDVPGELNAGWIDAVRMATGLAPLAVGLGDLTKVFQVGGDSGWVTELRDGGLVAVSGATGNDGISTLQLKVKGPKTVHFDWAVISEGGFDFLDYSLDGVPVAEISGWKGWEHRRLEVPEGDHVIEWGYRKDGSFGQNEDQGYVRNVQVVRSDLAITGTEISGNDVVVTYRPDAGWKNNLLLSNDLSAMTPGYILASESGAEQSRTLENEAFADSLFLSLNLSNDPILAGGPRLLGWWDFEDYDILDEVSGDRSRQGFPGSFSNRAQRANSRAGFGKALATNGTSGNNGTAGYVEVLDSAGTAELFPANGVTVSAWVKPGAGVEDTAIAGRFEWSGSGGGLSGFTLSQWVSGSFAMGVVAEGSGQMTFAAAPFQPGVWQHVVGTYDQTSVKLYLNGVKVAETALTGAIDRTPLPAHGFQIGRFFDSDSDRRFDGLIDDVGLWDGALSEMQIRRLADPE